MFVIVAASDNNVIGSNGQIPWHLGSDMKFFRSITNGCTVIMGRKTYESIGHPLKNRRNVVISKTMKYHPSAGNDVEVFRSLDDALKDYPCSFVIGGGELYKEAWEKASAIFITRVHTIIDGDTTIPPIEGRKLMSSDYHNADEDNDYDYSFEIWI